MVKLKGPLLSLSASGQVADILTFSKREKVNQVRYQRKQKDYVNLARETQRSFFQTAVSWWHELTDSEKSEWAWEGDNP